MHLLVSRRTPPPFLDFRAPVGQILAQGASGQALQTTTINPRSIPPTDLTPRQALASPPSSCLLAQANMQTSHPIHLSASAIVNCIRTPVNVPSRHLTEHNNVL